MNDRLEIITLEAQRLSVAERIRLVEIVLATLDQPDQRVDALWAAESERRLDLCDAGKMEVFDADKLLSPFLKR
jgi:putative addiction module component (TIGR02574 family)